jgi:hypothetical protein
MSDMRLPPFYVIKKRLPSLFVIVVVLIGLYCIFADTPFSWL